MTNCLFIVSLQIDQGSESGAKERPRNCDQQKAERSHQQAACTGVERPETGSGDRCGEDQNGRHKRWVACLDLVQMFSLNVQFKFSV